MKRKLKILCYALLLTLTPLLLGLRLYTLLAARPKVFSQVSAVPQQKFEVALVLGAGLNGQKPSNVLYDRIATAVSLYKKGRVSKLLMTGAYWNPQHNEPQVMKQAALRLGVPRDKIELDPKGFTTYESCFRAKHHFKISQAIIVTQAFHLDRALYLCNNLGIESIGVSSDRRNYGSQHWYWHFREFFATLKAWLMINFS